MSDPRHVLLLVLIVSAPWALVLIVAMARGYSVTVVLSRRRDQVERD